MDRFTALVFRDSYDDVPYSSAVPGGGGPGQGLGAAVQRGGAQLGQVDLGGLPARGREGAGGSHAGHRSLHGGEGDGGTQYLVHCLLFCNSGGMGANDVLYNDIWSYDHDTKTWAAMKKKMLEKRGFAAVAMVNFYEYC